MFRKRQKKEYPPGTFIPMPARICAIIQLCIAFSIILWNMSQPFMGEIFAFKSQLLLYQDVMGVSSPRDSEERLNRLGRNAERFESLSYQHKQSIIGNYGKLQGLLERSFLTKLGRSLHILLFEIPVFEQMWLILALVLPITLLKRVEGASQAIWLLPLLTTVYAFDNQWFGKTAAPSAEAQLFPSEHIIVTQYLDEPLSNSISEQGEQLRRGWNNYLIKEWANEVPSTDASTYHLQVENGEFLFNENRIKAMGSPEKLLLPKEPLKEPIVFLAVYFFWNFLFAVVAWKSNGGKLNFLALGSLFTKIVNFRRDDARKA